MVPEALRSFADTVVDVTTFWRSPDSELQIPKQRYLGVKSQPYARYITIWMWVKMEDLGDHFFLSLV